MDRLDSDRMFLAVIETGSFTAAAAAGVKIAADDLASDLHADAAYRANLISVMAQRAVAKAVA